MHSLPCVDSHIVSSAQYGVLVCFVCLAVTLCVAAHTVLHLQSPAGRERNTALPSHACVVLAPKCHLPSTDQTSAALKPNLQQEWHHAKNNHLGSIVVKPHSDRKAWWKCDKCPHGEPHEWESPVKNRSEGCDCPFCASVAVCSHNSLATLAPHVAKDWHHAENDLTPDDYTWRSSIT